MRWQHVTFTMWSVSYMRTQMWRVYQRGLERWIIDLLQPMFDGLVKEPGVPRFIQVGHDPL